MAAAPPRPARVAVALLFLVNGALFASWVPRIPTVKGGLGLSDGIFGVALLGMAIGGLGGSLLSGVLVSRYGSRLVTLASCFALCGALTLPGLVPSWATLAGALALLGAADASMDVGMNAHGSAVQQRYGRSIMNSFHGFWSLGAVVGSLGGSLAAARGVPVAVHLGAAALTLGLLAAATKPVLLAPGGDRERDKERTAGKPRIALPTRAVAVLGLMTLLAAIVEDAPASWSAVYLQEDLGAAPGVAGLGFAAFTAAMTVGRLLGDRVVERFGPVHTTRAGTLFGAAGLTAGLVVANPVAAIAGFALVGLGMSTVFPLAFSAAGNLPDVSSGQAIGMVALTARIGLLVGPPAIGGVSELLGLPAALALVVIACVALALTARGLASAQPH